MKIYRFCLSLCFSIALVTSCSNEPIDSGIVNNGDTAISSDYFPTSLNSYWIYDVANTNNNLNELSITNDSLYINSQNANAFTLGINDGLPPNGILSGFLSSGNLTRTNETLILDGILELPAEISNVIDFEIALNNHVLYDISAPINSELSTNGDTITQEFNGFPITINYELLSKSLGTLESITANGLVYNDIIGSELVLNVSASTTIDFAGIPINISILEPQDVLVSTYYFANAIGMVKSTSEINYQISDAAVTAIETAGQNLPIPTSGSFTSDENLNRFLIVD